jgi:spermidine synthase
VTDRAARRAPLLFLTVLIIATAGLVYELLAGAIATTVLGNSLRQYSTTIGVYLFAMGLGAYVSKFVDRRLAQRFVDVEYAAALVGGTQGLLLFLAYGRAQLFPVLLYGTLTIVGMLVGLEIPLLMRILRDDLDFKDLVAKVLTFDYLGALVGSLVFSVVLVEMLMVPLERIGLYFGLLNCTVGLMSTWVLADHIYPGGRLRLRLKGLAVAALLGLALYHSGRLRIAGEQQLYGERIVYLQQSPYQRIVLTGSGDRVQLYLDGNLQFSSMDEYRYHEALVHPAMAAAEVPEGRGARVLVLGGGDGLAVRELLRYPDLERVTLVDLDPAITAMAERVPAVRALNGGSLNDPRVEVINDDAMVWLDEERPGPFDVIIVDFPDPNNFSLGKLYTRRFYQLVRGALADRGAVAVQSTSPLFARKSFWCVERSMAAAGLHTAPYHVPVPSFGEWGYVLARPLHFSPPTRLPIERMQGEPLRYLNDAMLPALFTFPQDMAPVPVAINRLNHQILVQYYSAEWAQVN